MKPYVTANILGPSPGLPGIGNQLFQIAAVLSYAKDYGHEPLFPCLKHPSYGGYRDNFLKRLNVGEHPVGVPCMVYSEPSFDYNQIPKTDTSLLIQNSYLQSEKYFKHNRDFILDHFVLPKDDEVYLTDKYGSLDNATSMHIRRGDYLQRSDYHTNLTDTDYYAKALDVLQPERLLIFSDDMDWVKEHFPGHTYVEESDDYLEIFLMSFCKDNIIANSSFSWWGAWLNNNPNKIVVAPRNWFGPACHESTKDIVPEGWVVI